MTDRPNAAVTFNALIASSPMPPMEQMLGNIMHSLGYPRPRTWDHTLADAPLNFYGALDHNTLAHRLMSAVEMKHIIAAFNRSRIVRLHLQYDGKNTPKIVQERRNLWPDVLSPMQIDVVERFCREIQLELRNFFGENVSIVHTNGTWTDIVSEPV